MVVQTLDRIPGPAGLIGLHIGARNVQEFFPRGVDVIELELDHLRIVCSLEPSFWQDRPEIHDLRLSSWLESKRSSGKLSAKPAAVALIRSGESSFRLSISNVADEPDGSMDVPGIAYVEQITSPLEAVDRRKRNVERQPERRKVARLKSDELPTTAAAS
jgi:hypothetical protein